MQSLSVIEELRQQPQIEEKLAALSDDELRALVYEWSYWARPSQLAPIQAQGGGGWVAWLILAGRGFGKTRIGAEKVREWISQGFNRVNLIAATADDLRDVMVEGESGILAICPKHERPIYRISKRRLEWPNGARSLLFTAQEPDRLRGKQHEKLWGDEPAAWRYDEAAWDQASFGLRLGKNPQAILTTTPRPTKFIRKLMADPTTALTRGTTYENRSNLAHAFFSKIIRKYEGTRLGRQELNAEVLDDNPGALWKLADIEAARVSKYPELMRIVVAIDPAVTSNEDSDETGLIVVGMDHQDPAHYYVLEDASGVYTPDGWAKKAVMLYHFWEADRVIGEVNNGGDMIEAVIRHQDANVSYKSVRASHGKAIRAEPVAALYEQRRVHHHGQFAALEDQLTTWNPQTDTDSPDRLDADVWGVTELAGEWEGWAGLLKHYQRSGVEAAKAQTAPEVMPKADGVRPAPVKEDTTKLPPLKAYQTALSKMTVQELCSKCNQPLGNDVVTDGITAWHTGCDKPSWSS